MLSHSGQCHSLAKPLGGLGGLETTIEDAAALTGSAKLDISRRAVLVPPILRL